MQQIEKEKNLDSNCKKDEIIKIFKIRLLLRTLLIYSIFKCKIVLC